jgi:hypothetical protein
MTNLQMINKLKQVKFHLLETLNEKKVYNLMKLNYLYITSQIENNFSTHQISQDLKNNI